MTGIILDSILMLLLVAALGYGVRLEKKLTALRAGQMAFAGAVTELNAAAGRAENALASLRASGEEADMLHDRIIKARAVKQELEVLIARAPTRVSALPPLNGEGGSRSEPGGEAPAARAAVSNPTLTAAPSSLPMKGRERIIAALPDDEDRALRMAALAERIQGLSPSIATRPSREPGADSISAILGALTANQAAQQSLNRARRSLDDDLFAA